jgi:peroxiredoxin
VLLIIVSVIFIIVQLQPFPTPQVHLQPGMVAPDFQLNAVRGGTIRLQDLKGCAVLLSFLSTQANATDSPTSDPSRSQVTFLKSMDQQYDPRGARVLIIDATALLTGQRPDQNALLNFTYDWDLNTIPVGSDPDGMLAEHYGVIHVPTTFLIALDGRVHQVWNGLATTPQLAFALQALIPTSHC